ncbi:MAG: phosphoribosyltransferase [Candidatus Amulumruptor caecigallinarius]|nr:phosphoribosyltransferase [Candidatus Amulumruptor caecigallinarius]MCM1397159.1 phosphoribosyltransferase [Candidatus Amulumruptor caecigallinarius]MCM1453152.1 phosphoribosyltransferase [bacterium]
MRAVVTLFGSDFTDACRQLADEVKSRHALPDMMVGIRSGGACVAEAMAPHMPGVALAEVTLRRPSTARKAPLSWLLRSMPRWLANALRRVEASMRMKNARRKALRQGITLPHVTLPDTLTASSPRSVLIVDDSTDTGITLAAVAAAVCEALPEATVTAAVIARTESEQVVDLPEGVELHTPLYSDGSLVRFPWSLDSPRRAHELLTNLDTPSQSAR